MYWPGAFTTWFEAHNSFGLTAIGPKWGIAEGRVGRPVSLRDLHPARESERDSPQR